ncbi:MAG TPA: OmpA family protein, partial [Candidatus Kapabacteria bacterium]|nr:OmpA family protein [Candidatus Kapabacteria bacterium]
HGQLPLHNHVSFGIMPVWTFSQFTSNFYSYEGVLCGTFTSGKGNGPGIWLSMDYGFGKFAVAGIRASFLNEGGTFNTPLPTYQARDTATGEIITVERNNAFIASVHALSFGADVKLYPLQSLMNNRLYAILGGTFDLSIIHTFDERESITNTDKVVFIDGTSDHSIVSGTIDGMGARIGIMGGIGYDIPFSREWSLSPEISYNIGITKTNADYQWTTNYLNAGATLRYTIIPPPPVAEPPAPAPQEIPNETPDTSHNPLANTMKAKSVLLRVDVSARTVNGQAPPPILVEEVHVREAFPMLNYIFFDSLGATIPQRYVQLDSNSAKSFNDRDLPSTTLGVYHSILNITGKRLLENPNSKLTITGCRDEYSEGPNVSKARAEAVRDYFVNTWGISPNRMKIVVRGHPATESNPDYPEGRAENRRVELNTDNNGSVFAPVVVVESQRETKFEDGRVTKADSNSIDFVPDIISGTGVRDWKLSITGDSANVRTYTGSGEAPKSIPWDLKTSGGVPPSVQGHLNYTLTATDITGQTVTSQPHQLEINQRMLTRERGEQLDKEHTLEKFSLIVFNYNTKDMSSGNKSAAAEIAKHISPSSHVTITGYTDQLGSDDYDKDLATSRADNVANIIRKSADIPDSNLTVNGIGKSDLFPNDTPEGRFFCRTVQVLIENPADVQEGTKQ